MLGLEEPLKGHLAAARVGFGWWNRRRIASVAALVLLGGWTLVESIT